MILVTFWGVIGTGCVGGFGAIDPSTSPHALDSDDALLKMAIGQQEFGRPGLPDLSTMTEEEQIAYAMQMSLQGSGEQSKNFPLLGTLQ